MRRSRPRSPRAATTCRRRWRSWATSPTGIYPAILTEAGLAPALQTLADDAPLAVEVDAAPCEQLSEAVERAAYVFVAGAVEAAARAGADYIAATVRREREHVLVCVGRAELALPVHLADRVGALRGRVISEKGRLRAEIACA